MTSSVRRAHALLAIRHGCALAALLCLAGTAAPAAAAPPAWCKGAGEDKADFILDRALKDDDVVWNVHDLVGALCFPDGEASGKASELMAAWQAWSKKLEMNESDWSDAAAWAVAPQSSRYPNTTLPPEDAKKRWSALDPVEQYLALNYDLGDEKDANYLADALGPKLSEAGRLAYVLTACLNSNAKEVQWAMCQPDLDAFDFKKLVAELRADKKHPGATRFLIRLAAYQLLPEKLRERGPEIKAARDKDPAFAKMFELAAAARKQWEGTWKSDAALLDLALQMDDARVSRSRKAFADCDDKTWSAWKDAVGAIPAKRFGEVQRDEYLIEYKSGLLAVIAGDPRGYLAATAFYACQANGEKPDPLVRSLGILLERWPGFRGPRTAAHTAILTAGLELDDKDARIEYPDVYRRWFSQNGSTNGGGVGTIKSVTPQGDNVRVEFAPKLEKQLQCTESKRTNRITQIRSDGTLVYETLCLKSATVTVDRKSAPQTIKARYGAGLKPGMSVITVEDALIGAWPKDGVNTPAIIGGVAVK